MTVGQSVFHTNYKHSNRNVNTKIDSMITIITTAIILKWRGNINYFLDTRVKGTLYTLSCGHKS